VTLKEITFGDDCTMSEEASPCEANNPSRCWGAGWALTGVDWNDTANNPDHPICYVRSTGMRLTVKLEVKGSATTSGSGMIRVVGSDGVSGTSALSIPCGTETKTVSIVTSNLPSVVEAYEPMTLYWSIRPPGATDYQSIGVTQHDIYVTHGTPLTFIPPMMPGDSSGNYPTRRRLNFLCGAAKGQWDVLTVSDKIHYALRLSPPIDGDDGTLAGDWRLMAGVAADGTRYVGECHQQSHFMNACTRLIGIPVAYEYVTNASRDPYPMDNLETTSAADLGITQDLDKDGQTGDEQLELLFAFAPPTGKINNFEGSLYVPDAGKYYAVWPNLSGTTSCRLLVELKDPHPNHAGATQVWVYTPTIDEYDRGAREYVHQPPVPYPTCP
jgi:hypothetical protein